MGISINVPEEFADSLVCASLTDYREMMRNEIARLRHRLEYDGDLPKSQRQDLFDAERVVMALDIVIEHYRGPA